MNDVTRLDETVSDNVLESLVEFTSSDFFRFQVADFQLKYFHEFLPLHESKSSIEYNLSQTEIFHLFESLLNKLFESFADKINISIGEIYRQCKDAG
jgi:hypothetical protein